MCLEEETVNTSKNLRAGDLRLRCSASLFLGSSIPQKRLSSSQLALDDGLQSVFPEALGLEKSRNY